MSSEAMERIRRMESIFNDLRADPSRDDLLRELKRYYEGGQWLRDYELDEQGLLPMDQKRGVLSQDGIYNFLNDMEEATMQVTIDALQGYLHHQYGGRGTEQGMFMKLVEEIGEVAEVLNKRTGRKAADGTDLDAELGKELADVIHYAVAIAAISGLDLNRIILEKDRQASVKYHHDVNLETYIKETYHG